MNLEDHPSVKRYREINKALSTSEIVNQFDNEWLKQQALEAGADDVGLVDINRPELNDH